MYNGHRRKQAALIVGLTGVNLIQQARILRGLHGYIALVGLQLQPNPKRTLHIYLRGKIK